MRALVTGACGFVGGHLLRHLCEQGDEVLATALQPPRILSHPYHHLPVQRELLDCTQAEAVLDLIQRWKPESVYHLAGIAFVPEAEENFERVLRVNVAGTCNIFRACHLLNLKTTVVLISSAEVYGRIEARDLPLTESQPTQPLNNYSLSKAMAELVARRYSLGNTTIKAVIARPFNHIGPGQDHRFVASSFARQLALMAAGKSERILRVGNLDAQRDFSDVRDIARGYRLAATTGKGIYNFGSGRPTAVQEIVDTLVDIAGFPITIERDPMRARPAEIPVVYGDCSRAHTELSWRCEISLRQSLTDLYRFWQEQVATE